MTPHENLLSLYRRKGYEFAPVSFCMCPILQEKAEIATGGVPLPEYFDYPEGFSVSHTPGLPIKDRQKRSFFSCLLIWAPQ